MKKLFNTRVGGESYEVEYTGEWPALEFVSATRREHETAPAVEASKDFSRNDMVDGRNFLFEVFRVVRCDPEFAGLDTRLDAIHARVLLQEHAANEALGGLVTRPLDAADVVYTAAESADIALRDKRAAQIDALKELKVSSLVNRLRLYREGREKLLRRVNSWRWLLPMVPEGSGQYQSLVKCMTELDDDCSWLEIHAEGDKARR